MNLKVNKNFLFLITFIVFVFSTLPIGSYGVGFGDPPAGNININIETRVLVPLLNIVWVVAVTVVIVLFVVAGFKLITAQGSPEELKTAKRFVIWGILGVAVIILAFSIISILKLTLFPPAPPPPP